MLSSMKRRMMKKPARTDDAASKREALRQFREHFDLSLENLADQSGLSRSMLSKFELGQRDLSPEAWTRVIATIQKRLAEDEARRQAERAKAKETAAKMGVASFASVRLALPWLFQTDEETAKEKAQLAKSAALNNLLVQELSQSVKDEESKLLRQLLTHIRKNPEKAAREYLALLEWRQKLLDLEAQGHVMMPKAVEEERDQLKVRVAELEKELKAYQELLPQSTRRIEELEQELVRERENKASGGAPIDYDALAKEHGVVTITPDVPERKTKERK